MQQIQVACLQCLHCELVAISNRPGEDLNPQEGQQLQLTNQDNQPIVVVITKVTEESITLDGNPPLAGRDLTFDLELVTIA